MNLADNFFILCVWLCVCVCVCLCLFVRVRMHVDFVNPPLLVTFELSRTEIKITHKSIFLLLFFFQENTGEHWTGSCV